MFRLVFARGDVLHDYHDGYVRSSPNVGYVGKHTSPMDGMGRSSSTPLTTVLWMPSMWTCHPVPQMKVA